MRSGRTLNITGVSGVTSQDADTVVAVDDMLAYVAGAGVVVSRVHGDTVADQRFFCANSGKSASAAVSSANSYLNMIPGFGQGESPATRRIDSFGLPVSDEPELICGTNPVQQPDGAFNGSGNGTRDSSDEPGSPSKLANKIRSISCIAMSPDGRLLAVGESGYQPRILVYSLAPESNLKPVFVIHDHQFGVGKLRFSPDSTKLASLGFLNDGYLNVWSFTARPKTVSLVGVNRCSAQVNQMIWEQGLLATVGTRHVKVWFVEEAPLDEPKRLEPLKGKNVLLNNFLNSNFIDSTMLNATELLLLSDQGDLASLDLGTNEYRLVKIYQLGTDVSQIWHVEGSLYYADSEIRSLKLDQLYGSSDAALEVKKRPLSPLKHRKRHILSIVQPNPRALLYLTEGEEIVRYDIDTGVTATLIGSLMKDLSGFKRCADGSLVVWSKNGIIKRISGLGVQFVHQVRLPSGELISNELVSVEMGVNGEIFAGDKFGDLFFLQPDGETVQTVKAHESSITDMVYFQVGVGDTKTGLLATISRDRMIQVFQQQGNDWELFQTLSLHKGTLNSILHHKGRIFVSSTDRTISVHRIEVAAAATAMPTATPAATPTDQDDLESQFAQLQVSDTIKIHQEKIISDRSTPISMGIYGDELVCSTADRNLSVFKIGQESVDKLRSFKLFNEAGDSLLVEKFCVHANCMYISCNDKSLRMFQYGNGKQLGCSWGHSESIVGMVLQGDDLMSVGSDGCMFRWGFAADVVVPDGDSSEDSVQMVSPVQKVTRKILNSGAPTSLTPTKSSLRRSGVGSTVLGSPRGVARSPGRNPNPPSPTALRASTLNRLSQSPLRDSLGKNKPDLSLKGDMSAVGVVRFLHDLERALQDGRYGERDLKAIRGSLESCWSAVGGDKENRLLEVYSDKLVSLLQEKLNK